MPDHGSAGASRRAAAKVATSATSSAATSSAGRSKASMPNQRGEYTRHRRSGGIDASTKRCAASSAARTCAAALASLCARKRSASKSRRHSSAVGQREPTPKGFAIADDLFGGERLGRHVEATRHVAPQRAGAEAAGATPVRVALARAAARAASASTHGFECGDAGGLASACTHALPRAARDGEQREQRERGERTRSGGPQRRHASRSAARHPIRERFGALGEARQHGHDLDRPCRRDEFRTRAARVLDLDAQRRPFEGAGLAGAHADARALQLARAVRFRRAARSASSNQSPGTEGGGFTGCTRCPGGVTTTTSIAATSPTRSRGGSITTTACGVTGALGGAVAGSPLHASATNAAASARFTGCPGAACRASGRIAPAVAADRRRCRARRDPRLLRAIGVRAQLRCAAAAARYASRRRRPVPNTKRRDGCSESATRKPPAATSSRSRGSSTIAATRSCRRPSTASGRPLRAGAGSRKSESTTTTERRRACARTQSATTPRSVAPRGALALSAAARITRQVWASPRPGGISRSRDRRTRRSPPGRRPAAADAASSAAACAAVLRLGASGRAEAHRRRHVEREQQRARALFAEALHPRRAGARGRIPVDRAHVVARHVGSRLLELDAAAAERAAPFADQQTRRLAPTAHREDARRARDLCQRRPAKAASIIGLPRRGSMGLRSLDGCQHRVDDSFGPHAVGLRLVAEHDAVTQHVGRACASRRRASRSRDRRAARAPSRRERGIDSRAAKRRPSHRFCSRVFRTNRTA